MSPLGRYYIQDVINKRVEEILGSSVHTYENGLTSNPTMVLPPPGREW